MRIAPVISASYPHWSNSTKNHFSSSGSLWTKRLLATQPAPTGINASKRFFEKFELMLGIAQPAFESDSTRTVALLLDAFKTPVFSLPGQKVTTESYHNLSHHGQDGEKVKQHEAADRQHMALLR